MDVLSKMDIVLSNIWKHLLWFGVVRTPVAHETPSGYRRYHRRTAIHRPLPVTRPLLMFSKGMAVCPYHKLFKTLAYIIPIAFVCQTNTWKSWPFSSSIPFLLVLFRFVPHCPVKSTTVCKVFLKRCGPRLSFFHGNRRARCPGGVATALLGQQGLQDEERLWGMDFCSFFVMQLEWKCFLVSDWGKYS